MGDDSDFKVVDRRASSGAKDSESKGEGFVMKQAPEPPSAGPAEPTSVDFATFVFSLATGAFIQLGLAPDPTTGKTEKNLALAQQNIDILALLKDKTRGNLSDEERQMLESLLAEVQLRFAEVARG